ncbi:hypothetical protein Dalu01_02467 [Deinococcus aluminii]|uniref:histidine kinase n=1 Tax=Deinococcus aluminii TaxID=1656885 RepID=A0ABP9XFD0_9DEIO
MCGYENVTERKLVELRGQDLGTKVDERVQRKTQMLRWEVSELDAFIGAVSHDLRAPLRHIQGHLRMLRGWIEHQLTPADPRLREVDLGEVVRRAWTYLAPETEGRETEWVAGELPNVRGDPELLRLAFENLLSNAIKSTSGRAQPCIEVGASRGGLGGVRAGRWGGFRFLLRPSPARGHARKPTLRGRPREGRGSGPLGVSRSGC